MENEYKVGDRVRFTSIIARGSLGKIVGIHESTEEPYDIELLDENGNSEDDPLVFYNMHVDQFEPEDAIYESDDAMTSEIDSCFLEGANAPGPRYCIGDIVTSSDDPEKLLYVVSESTLADSGEYVYELTDAHSAGIPNMQVSESVIEFHFHDKWWENKLKTGEMLLEMAVLKWGFMSIKLAVYGGEGGGYPHFHFYKDLKPEGGIPESRRLGGGCLTIETPNYFVHGGHTDKLSSKEIKGLIEFLKEKNKTQKSVTNWEYIIGLWNDSNDDMKQLPLDLPIPDYKSDMPTIQEEK